MYHHSFEFVIISGNRHIEELLGKMTPIEDCDYAFKTVSGVCGAEVGDKPDVAFIYDSVGGMGASDKSIKENKNSGEFVILAKQGSGLLTDPETVSSVSEIWIMPESGEYDDGLLSVYFQRLVNRMKQSADSRKQKICFETLINSVPDIAWFKDVKGAHLIVNDSFCTMVEKTKEQIYKQGHCYIWNASRQDEEVCLQSDRAIMKFRGTMSFEETIRTRTDVLLLKSYKSALIDINGEIFGTCGIAHDVTALRNMSTELELVLNSVPFVAIVEDMNGTVINKNAKFDKCFPEFADIVGKSSDDWKNSLDKRLLLDGRLKEVVNLSNEDEQVMVFDEEPIFDNNKRSIGKIITLTDITIERNMYEQSEHLANTDYLTELNNRRNLMDYLESVYTADDVTLVMMDLDNFKHVNDTYGHEAGDRALIEAAVNMRECFKDGFVSRMGGDEFMAVLRERNIEQVKSDTERLLEMTQESYARQEEFKGVTVSAGIIRAASIPAGKRNVANLLNAADEMLYKAKNNGKNCYYVYGE